MTTNSLGFFFETYVMKFVKIYSFEEYQNLKPSSVGDHRSMKGQIEAQ